ERNVVKLESPIRPRNGRSADRSQERRGHVRDQNDGQPRKSALAGIEQAVSVRIFEADSRDGARARSTRNQPPEIDIPSGRRLAPRRGRRILGVAPTGLEMETESD